LRSFFPLDARVMAQYTSRWRIPPSTRNFSNSFHSRQAIKMRYICRGALRLDDEKALSKLFPWRHRRFKRMEIATRSGGFEDFFHFNCSLKNLSAQTFSRVQSCLKLWSSHVAVSFCSLNYLRISRHRTGDRRHNFNIQKARMLFRRPKARCGQRVWS
jgi:hypothetical protein